jgi:hypothetical protein
MKTERRATVKVIQVTKSAGEDQPRCAAMRFCLRITITIAQPPMMPNPAMVGYQVPQP